MIEPIVQILKQKGSQLKKIKALIKHKLWVKNRVLIPYN
jgi:hypothetical protein